MTFANPGFLAALVLVPLAGLFVYWADKRRRRALASLGNPGLLARLSASVNWRGRRWRTALWLAALALLIVAIARPQWGSETQEVDQQGLQVMVALDVSQSMLVQDMKPSRLDRAKLEIRDLMEKLNGDEIGVVLFSGASFVQVPLTSDYMTALSYMENAQPDVISRAGTVIGDAIRTATKAFDDNLSSQKVLVVMTDGEDVETDPVAAAKEAADKGVLIYTIGFGTPEGEPVPETDRNGQVIGVKRDADGNPVISRMDEATLQKVAEEGGGRYFRATPAGAELDSLMSEIDGLQKAELQSRTAVRRIEHFQFFLALALLALMAGELIPDRIEQKSQVASPLTPSPSGRWLGEGASRH